MSGVPVSTASDFNEVVEAFSYDELVVVLSFVGFSLQMCLLLIRVPFHHEMAQVCFSFTWFHLVLLIFLLLL